jgi:hypothetical protein
MSDSPTDFGVSEARPIVGQGRFAALRRASDQVRFTSPSSSFSQVNHVERGREARVKNFTRPRPFHSADARDRGAQRAGELPLAPGSLRLVRRFATAFRFEALLRTLADEIGQ